MVSIAIRMAYSLTTFFMEMDLKTETAALLAESTQEQAWLEVIDLALVEPATVPAIHGLPPHEMR